jgi:hypothetical protein
MIRTCLTDAQWEKMEPHCHGKPSDPGRAGVRRCHGHDYGQSGSRRLASAGGVGLRAGVFSCPKGLTGQRRNLRLFGVSIDGPFRRIWYVAGQGRQKEPRPLATGAPVPRLQPSRGVREATQHCLETYPGNANESLTAFGQFDGSADTKAPVGSLAGASFMRADSSNC